MSDYGLVAVREPSHAEVERFARERGCPVEDVMAIYGGKAPFVVCEYGKLAPLPITDRDPGDESDAA